jgi:hypothetical protein
VLDKVTPLSPILFVFTAELLQVVINEACQNGMISLPLEHSFGPKFPILLYADDNLLITGATSKFETTWIFFLPPLTSELITKNLSGACQHTPVDMVNTVAHDFGCQIESLSFNYLGLPRALLGL